MRPGNQATVSERSTRARTSGSSAIYLLGPFRLRGRIVPFGALLLNSFAVLLEMPARSMPSRRQVRHPCAKFRPLCQTAIIIYQCVRRVKCRITCSDFIGEYKILQLGCIRKIAGLNDPPKAQEKERVSAERKPVLQVTLWPLTEKYMLLFRCTLACAKSISLTTVPRSHYIICCA